MSRIAKLPVSIPSGVDIKILDNQVTVYGKNGQLKYVINSLISFDLTDNNLQVQWDKADKKATAQAGTARAIINNMVVGVSAGFEKKLTLTGVGYRAQAKGSVLNLALGYSHPIDYEIPSGISVETPTQTEIILKGNDKQLLGEVAAKIRAYRAPEPYKGKGIKYADENIIRKEAKKK